MMTDKIRRFSSVSLGLAATALVSVSSAADAPDLTHPGRSSVYRNLSTSSLEAVSTPDSILALVEAPDSSAPTAIWAMLEHGERVECLSCIPYVSKLLYASSPKTREISAWWLRRRIFGVFGKGEAYEQTVDAVSDQSKSELTRAYAASALGEFLEGAGIAPVATALVKDRSPMVRLAAANALVRLNDQGPNAELASALTDGDEEVRLAALSGVTQINVFSNVDAVVGMISDASPLVRRRAAQTLGALRSADSVMGLMALTSADTEPDAGVRSAAVWALGQIGDPAAREAALAAQTDVDSGVRDAATVALIRL